MKPLFGLAVLAVVTGGLTTPAPAAICAPEKLVHIAFAFEKPGLAPGSFAGATEKPV